MKKKAFFVIGVLITLLFVIVLSCAKKDVSSKEDTLNWIAPSGQSIASSVATLKAEASQIILKKYGSNQSFELTGVKYFPIKTGYSALVSYKLSNGTIGNYASVSEVNYNIDPQSISSLVKIETPTIGNQLKVDRSSIKITCNGTCGCCVTGSFDTETGQMTFGCSCSSCTCTVTVE